MEKEFITYLKSIGITEAIRKRIETIHEFYREICPDKITGIFVTNYMEEDGERMYENLWFFSENYCMEAKQFIAKDDFDITPIRSRIYYWTIRKQDYDFKKATEKSRLYLKFKLSTRIEGEFKASKENCDYLREIFLKYVVPNLVE